MEGVAAEKIPGGKLVRVKVTYDDVINDIKITGDFFLHPEDAIDDIEKSLFGIKASSDESVISKIISEVVNSGNVELVGITPESLAKVIRSAIK